MLSERKPKPRKPHFSFETVIVLRAALCALPGVLISLYFVAQSGATWETWVTVLVFLLLPFPFLAWRLQSWITNPLKVAANILGSIREGDFTLRSRRISETSGTIVELYQEINTLATMMDKTRISSIETRNAIDKITANIDVATIIVDSNREIVQANEAARRLIASINKWEVSPIGRTVDQLNVAFCIDASSSDFSRFSFVEEGRRFEGRRGIFRMDGERYDLIAVTDITTAASEQERASWKRLLRVLGHELNNSLAPIHSLSNTLSKMVRATDFDPETKADMLESLGAISSRSDSIIRFMQDYTRLAKLPEPAIETFDLQPLLQKAAQLFSGVVVLENCPDNVTVSADKRQLEQAIINLMKNAAEAASHCEQGVECHVSLDTTVARIEIIDAGPGIANPENIFVPFYTTKEKGSGIGLAISKQIIEAIGGSLTLANRLDGKGCVATITVPTAKSAPTHTAQKARSPRASNRT